MRCEFICKSFITRLQCYQEKAKQEWGREVGREKRKDVTSSDVPAFGWSHALSIHCSLDFAPYGGKGAGLPYSRAPQSLGNVNSRARWLSLLVRKVIPAAQEQHTEEI